MFKADSRRISWFLGLQRVLQFPKYFLAPPKALRPRQGSEYSNFEATPGGVQSLPSEHPPSTRPTCFRAVTLPMLRRVPPRAVSLSKIRLRHQVERSEAAPPRGTSRQRDNQDLPWTAVTRGISEGSTPPRGAVGQRLPTLDQGHGTIANPRDWLPSSTMSASLAPNSVPISGPELREPQGVSVLTRADPRTRAVFGSDPHHALSQQSSSAQDITSQYQTSSGDSVGPTRRDQPQQSGPAISTLHIDGSALGRWTVQHLERALGKPSTGMTGVDPRATLPRSRIAPF
jgi:hypothetical protein